MCEQPSTPQGSKAQTPSTLSSTPWREAPKISAPNLGVGNYDLTNFSTLHEVFGNFSKRKYASASQSYTHRIITPKSMKSPERHNKSSVLTPCAALVTFKTATTFAE